MPKIVVVALDSNVTHKNFNSYENLRSSKKIAIIKSKINFICQNLQEIHPEEKWIITWREYGINHHKSYLSSAGKKKLKQELLIFTEKYPNLTIIAGTAVSQKESTPQKSQEILKYYEGINHFVEKEKKFRPSQILLHEESAKKILSSPEIKPASVINIIRNTCFIFEGKEIKRHDKMAPYNEIYKELPNAIFKPGGKPSRNINHFITLTHPNGTHFDVALEICREHILGVAKNEEKTHIKKNKPMIHFILSASCKLHAENLCADYAIHIDVGHHVRLVQREHPTEGAVILYANNLLEENTNLIHIKPTYLFQPYFTKHIKKISESLETNSKSDNTLNNYLEMFFNKIESKQLFVSDANYWVYLDIIFLLKATLQKAKDQEDKQLTLNNKIEDLEKIMQEQYLLSLPYFDDKITPTQKKLILHELNNYQSSRNSLSSIFFRNCRLTQEKINLTKELIDQISATNNKMTIIKLLLQYINLGKNSDLTHNIHYNLTESNFLNCLKNNIKLILEKPHKNQSTNNARIRIN